MTQHAARLVGLIGWPVEHSVSPEMHNTVFAELGMDWHYTLLPTLASDLGTQLRKLERRQFRGVNVTVPHKQSILPYLGRISESAQAIGAVNTVLFRAEGTSGDNTDGQGFLDALRHVAFTLPGKRALVLGAGGGARAVAYALGRSGCAVTLYNRTEQRARALQQDMQRLGFQLSVIRPYATPWTALDLDRWDLLVNTTPVGMWPDAGVSPWPESAPMPSHWTVFDLVYNPIETRLLQQARAAGAQAIDGLEMLVRQGALSFEMWTGIQPPVDIMRKAARDALETKNETPTE